MVEHEAHAQRLEDAHRAARTCPAGCTPGSRRADDDGGRDAPATPCAASSRRSRRADRRSRHAPSAAGTCADGRRRSRGGRDRPVPSGRRPRRRSPRRSSAVHSFQTRRSRGTGRFWTRMPTCGRGRAEVIVVLLRSPGVDRGHHATAGEAEACCFEGSQDPQAGVAVGGGSPALVDRGRGTPRPRHRAPRSRGAPGRRSRRPGRRCAAARCRSGSSSDLGEVDAGVVEAEALRRLQVVPDDHLLGAADDHGADLGRAQPVDVKVGEATLPQRHRQVPDARVARTHRVDTRCREAGRDAGPPAG